MRLGKLRKIALELLEKYELPVESAVFINDEGERRFLVFSPLEDTYRCTKRVLRLLSKEANELGVKVYWESNPSEEELEIFANDEDGNPPEEISEEIVEEFLEQYPYWVIAREVFGIEPLSHSSRGFLILFYYDKERK
jgi:hypothetical protein